MSRLSNSIFFHTIISEKECLSETLSSIYFMKGFLRDICLKEKYYNFKDILSSDYVSKPSFEFYNEKLFYYLIENKGFNEGYSRLRNTKKNVAVFNLFWSKNYGAILTAYALQTILLKMGYNPYLIKYTNKKLVEKNTDPFWKFEQENLFSSKNIINFNDLSLLNKYYDNFIVGSDQIWRYKYTKHLYKTYFLSFVDKNKKKIAYAASFGKNYWEGRKKVTKKIRKNIRTFDGISVREKSGIKICKNTFKVKCKAVFDPVFIMKKNDWKALLKKSTINLNSFCLIYILDETFKLNSQINIIIKSLNITGYWLNIGNTNVYDFLKSFQSSQRVITDSYHGLCFSIIFKKDFICLNNKGRGEERFISLLSDLNLMDRLYDDFSEVKWENLPPIDYKKIENIIEEKRKEGIDFLLSNLEK
ncbi:hypothetical protein BCR36DRAFT_440694 [Piromyces finnis]|uniref:Polysaccharide pyruvyl transferase domain-containing protein n=1 Tax=Piromyces finnis TaxID=1754191 RepID=A0A1Y1UQT1_9FUNG|nr:hypothetical protein BCR36DRAFT_440694 [Piromyces finnis]|eukprot:ORX39505.1 hypothetical protein BCR36DRAFT_440694 [Piromyces finnis]